LIKFRFSSLLDRLQPSETAVLLVTAVTVGAGTGLGAVFFIQLIAFIQSLFFQSGAILLGFMGRGLFILAPLIGGLLAGPIIHYFAQEAKGHGVPEVMQAIALRGGRIRPRVVVAKVVASALCIGSGAVRYRHTLERLGARVPPDDDDLHVPHARLHASLAQEFGPVDAIQPVYVRSPDAKPMPS